MECVWRAARVVAMRVKAPGSERERERERQMRLQQREEEEERRLEVNEISKKIASWLGLHDGRWCRDRWGEGQERGLCGGQVWQWGGRERRGWRRV